MTIVIAFISFDDLVTSSFLEVCVMMFLTIKMGGYKKKTIFRIVFCTLKVISVLK